MCTKDTMMGKFSFLFLVASCFNAAFPMFFGRGGGFGFGGGGFGFKMAPPGPVSLQPVNSSTRWADILQDTVQQALDHCKSVRMCNATDWVTRFDSQCSECHPCTCGDTCYLRADCCIDKLLREVSERLVLDTTPLDDPIMGCHSTYITEYELATHAFMADRCLAGFHGTEVVNKCTTTTANETDSQWPVWSPASDTTYRNADCALCNDEDVNQIVKWDLKIECDRGVHMSDTSSEDVIIEEAREAPSCHVSFVPPQGCAPSACRPSRGSYIDTCNATGRRFSHDEALWKACEVFHGKMTLDGNTYKNVFCAMCNDEEVEALGQCADEWPFPFFLVLNVTRFQRAALEPADGRCTCPHDEIYDRYEMKCRQLHCSMTRTLRNRQCVPLVTNSTGLFYDVAISLTPSDLHHPVYLKDKSSLKQVARNIRTAFLLQGSTTSGWDIQIDHLRVNAQAKQVDGHFSGNNSEDEGVLQVIRFKVHIQFGSMWPELAENLESRLSALMRSQWNVSVDGKPKRSFRATPLYVNADKENATETFSSVRLYASDDNILEYAVDISDRQIQASDDPPLGTDFYLLVSEALRCAKVSFCVSNETEPADAQLRVNASTGMAYHVPSNKFISFDFVELRDDCVVLVCADQLYDSLDTLVDHLVPEHGNHFSAQLGEVSMACKTLSVVCLCLVLFTYGLFPELRTLPGKKTVGLAVTLLLAMLLLEVGVFLVELPIGCMVVGVLAHFFLLSAFTWITISSFHAYRVFRRAMAPGLDEREYNTNIILKYVVVAMVLPAVIVAVTLLGNLVASQNDCAFDVGYGNGVCFLSNHWSVILSAILPISVAVVLTLFLCLVTACAPARLTREERKEAARPHRHQFALNVRISALMGVAWLTGMAAGLTDLEVLWYIFVVLSCLLGVCVFIEFVCNRRVLKLYRSRFFQCCKREKRYKKDHKFTAIET